MYLSGSEQFNEFISKSYDRPSEMQIGLLNEQGG